MPKRKSKNRNSLQIMKEMARENDYSLQMIKAICGEFIDRIYNDLVEGESVYIKRVGILQPGIHKLGNKFGKNGKGPNALYAKLHLKPGRRIKQQILAYHKMKEGTNEEQEDNQ